MTKRVDITPGTQFNKLTYIQDEPSKDKRVRLALFRCACGNTKVMALNNVRSGRSSTCGCEQFACHIKHGQALQTGSTTLYRRWESMRERCNNSNTKYYHQYGGRGITVCTEWNDFNVFAAWAVNSGFKESLTLDRKDNNKGYSPDNCRWVSMAVQMANRRKTPNTIHTYIGVQQLPYGRWRTGIRVNGKTIYIGIYDTEIEAVIARDTYIKVHKLPHTLNLK